MLIKKNKIPVKQIILIGFLPSFLKKIVYRIKGYKIGKNVSFGMGSVVIGKDVVIGDNSSFGLISVVRAKSVNIGRFVKVGALTMIDTGVLDIGDDSRINEKVIVGGTSTPESMLKVGKRVIIMEYSYINTTKPIIIGDDSGIGGHCLLFTHGSWLSQLDGFPVSFAPITIGNNVWLPWRVFVMPGVEIGNQVVVGANSLISKNVPSNVLIAGSPAKIIATDYPKSISDEKKDLIFSNILSEFCDHLAYNDFNVVVDKVGINTMYTVSKGKSLSQLFISKNGQLPSFVNSNNILIMYSETNITKNISMCIDLLNKQRIGKSDVGEEFLKFISRYGIRFNRID